MKPVIVLTGPTAVGKTDLSIKLAKLVNGEIISADSMQVYKEMNIGTAKITAKEMQGVRHHLIDILEPDEDFNVALFTELATDAAKNIHDRGKIPVVAGGTGFYIQAFLKGVNFNDEPENEKERLRLEKIAESEEGRKQLYDELALVDPEAAKKIHPNNIKRVIRALSFYKLNGNKISEHNDTEKEKPSRYNSCYFVLTMDREKLYQRIEKRIDIMVEAGLIEEVKRLYDRGLTEENISMQGIGYKEILEYIKGNVTKEEALYNLRLNTRHFAKRQLTWFRHEKDAIIINKDEFKNDDEILLYMEKILRSKGIID
ncbi:MAG: tRNA (adenosine(37)-N6)-dimethylallyltransferase MiaA [Eubacterium sp.]|nr:tRNA (adenosine(37)-N6)-dimethylallyltransferase MiaA [Eubacterium sp.]